MKHLIASLAALAFALFLVPVQALAADGNPAGWDLSYSAVLEAAGIAADERLREFYRESRSAPGKTFPPTDFFDELQSNNIISAVMLDYFLLGDRVVFLGWVKEGADRQRVWSTNKRAVGSFPQADVDWLVEQLADYSKYGKQAHCINDGDAHRDRIVGVASIRSDGESIQFPIMESDVLWATGGGQHGQYGKLLKLLTASTKPSQDRSSQFSDLSEELLSAAARGHISCMASLRKLGADLNSESAHTTPLIEAIAKKQVEAVDWLLRNGADANQLLSDNSQTPLIAAASGGSLLLVSKLVERGADVNLGTRSIPETPLVAAVQSRNIETVRYLLAHGARVSAHEDAALFAAVKYARNAEIANALIHAGAHANAIQGKRTPLMEVASGVGLEDAQVLRLLKVLVQAGANVNWISPDCGSAIEAARRLSRVVGRNAAENFLLEHGADASLSERCRTQHRVAAEQKAREVAKADEQFGIVEFAAADLDTNLARFRHPVMLFFYDDGCGWCTKMDAIVANIAKAYRGKIETARVDVKKVRAAADRYNLTALPTLLLVKNGVVGKPLVGAKDEPATEVWLDRELNAKSQR